MLSVWVLGITINYRHKNQCSHCGQVTKYGGWVEADGQDVFLCSADYTTYLREQRLAEARQMGAQEAQYDCPVCRKGNMQKVANDVETEAFPINRCGHCGAVLVTGDRDEQGKAEAESDDDAFTGALIAGVVAASVASSISSSSSSC